MDFYTITENLSSKGVLEVFANYRVIRSKDLMIRGRAFYAIWDEEAGLWSTDEYDVPRIIDKDLDAYQPVETNYTTLNRKYLGSFGSNRWLNFRNYIGHISDSSHQLDENLTFSNTKVTKEDYVSKRLPYPLEKGSIEAWDELVSTLYAPEEREKIEWAIGAVMSGDSKHIQKFLVLYGSAGTGKSTILNILQKLTEGYYTTFEAKALTGNNNSFSTEVFRENPLVAIQHDGDLSKIEDNTKLNSIVSHEEMTMNEKFKPSYTARINAFLFMGTNKPVRITDAKSGIIRRLIDVKPTGEKLSSKRYQTLYSQIDFELGAIAYHCLEVYRSLGKDYYSGYRPTEMMLQTDVFFNYIETYYDVFKAQNGVSLTQAYEFYKSYCEDANVEYKLAKYKFREELRNYFDHFHDRFEVDGVRIRSYYEGFNSEHFKAPKVEDDSKFSLVMDEDESLLDDILKDCPAQLANRNETPIMKWSEVSTTLKDIDTHKIHYVKPPENHIVIDFDLKGPDGKKSAERNLEAASSWPSTYAEYSKSGAGIHLHYDYQGDASELSRIYDEGIEVKIFTGDSSLRRKLVKCNSVPVAKISSGLPLKEKKVINAESVKSEKALRDLIMRNLNKEIHPGTKPSMDFIHKILEDAYSSGLKYDVTDLRGKILNFANNSTNQALYCIKLIQNMRFKSDDVTEALDLPKEERLVIFDTEIFPNLFVLCWKFRGDSKIVKLINPTPAEIESLLSLKLVGFNCRKYDNHILYGAFMGYNNEQLYKLSQKIISGSRNALFGEAYNLSYTDIYDFSSKKQSLKKWEIELGINHQELGLDWDKPVDEKDIPKVLDYCANDVEATEAVLDHLEADFVAREILADLSGLSVNHTTQQHASKIVFGEDSRPQKKFVYTDLSETFPGYSFELGKSLYRGEDPGEGGYVHYEPGIYYDVVLLDVESMHPTSIEELDMFGEYTKNYSALKKARLAIKRGEIEEAKKMFGGRLARHLTHTEQAEALSYALKLVVNIVYGLTSASFDNAFRDPRNVDNIVAKRGALFMIDLKHFVQERGFTVAHIKTDSIKIPNATKEIIEEVMEFGNKYGYTFAHEATYEKLCLVNGAVYVAKTKQGAYPPRWTATGAQFAHPIVFKTMFSHEPIVFDDYCETKAVKTALYLDFSNEDTPMVFDEEGEFEGLQFIGKTGRFVPVTEGGGVLLRKRGENQIPDKPKSELAKSDLYTSVTGTKGYRWLEAQSNDPEILKVDKRYSETLLDEAYSAIAAFGDIEAFLA